jgi:MYXO-CTERM domain-containing protein
VGAANSQAATIDLFLQGKGGFGLLPTNENVVINGNPGSGGEILGGCTFDTVSKLLVINVGWGSGNGFTDLTGTATASHIHSPGNFTTSTGVIISFVANPSFTFNTSASSGSVAGSVTLTAAQEGELMSNLFYVNVHTAANANGEIRGNLMVPEPATGAMGALALGAAALRRRRGV